jgi:hypothetical protein
MTFTLTCAIQLIYMYVKHSQYCKIFSLLSVSLEYLSLIWRRHHCQWYTYALRSWPLSSEGCISCHTTAATRGLGFSGLIWRTSPARIPIQSPLTTHKGTLKTYYCSNSVIPHAYLSLWEYCLVSRSSIVDDSYQIYLYIGVHCA